MKPLPSQRLHLLKSVLALVDGLLRFSALVTATVLAGELEVERRERPHLAALRAFVRVKLSPAHRCPRRSHHWGRSLRASLIRSQAWSARPSARPSVRYVRPCPQNQLRSCREARPREDARRSSDARRA